MVDLFIKENVRMAFYARDVSLEAAASFLDSNKFGVARDKNGTYYTREELEDAQSIRSIDRNKLDYTIAVSGEIFEGADRELSSTSDGSGGEADNTESSTDSDNKWD